MADCGRGRVLGKSDVACVAHERAGWCGFGPRAHGGYSGSYIIPRSRRNQRNIKPLTGPWAAHMPVEEHERRVDGLGHPRSRQLDKSRSSLKYGDSTRRGHDPSRPRGSGPQDSLYAPVVEKMFTLERHELERRSKFGPRRTVLHRHGEGGRRPMTHFVANRCHTSASIAKLLSPSRMR
jgi:hypothetical protein